ncbi:Polyadenylate-binding protein 2 [Platanthera guangdongensis]|uniref:Polyadenylate-binding protein 2 n=1 Tax=Platanthera guangdongensis TaxID=2320717 RepID=A0ABR2LI48_9ASPA
MFRKRENPESRTVLEWRRSSSSSFPRVAALCKDLLSLSFSAQLLANAHAAATAMNLDKAIDNKALQDTFFAFGTVLSCKVAIDPYGHSKGYSFVQFNSTEAAQNAIDKLNGMLLNDKQVYVGPFLRRQERENFLGKTKFSNVFVKNLSSSTTEEDLAKIFGEYGRTTSIVVMRDLDGKSKCFGFVNFENPDDAATAVQELNAKKMEDKEWYVGRAQKKTEREQELKTRFEQSITGTADKYQWVNLYLKNLDDSIGDEKLNELFSVFGTITSCNFSRQCFSFVSFI